MAGLNKEIWIDVIKEGLYPDNSFLTASVDMSELVEYNTINLAEAGVDPNVLINNNIFPVPVVARVDIPLALPLDVFDTENTVVRNLEEIETAYNKMESVVRSHRNALRLMDGRQAAYNWAPQIDAPFHPVLKTTGAANSYGWKSLTFEDVLELETKFMGIDANPDELNLCLNHVHLGDLKKQDLGMFKTFMKDRKLFSFNVFIFSRTPHYDTATATKKAFGAVPGPLDTLSSVAWMKSEVMKCEGDYDVFAKYKDPEERGDVIGFQQRFLALPIRNKYHGAIFSDI